MAPDWQHLPPQRLAPASSGSQPVPPPDEAKNAEAERETPQYEWVYNSDHNDPVNFGYMFLKPVGTRPTRANSGPEYLTPQTASVSPTPQPVKDSTGSTSLRTPVSASQEYYPASQAFHGSTSYDHITPITTPAERSHPIQFPQPSQSFQPSSQASSSQDNIYEHIPYRASPSRGTPSSSSPEQSSHPEALQWEQHGSAWPQSSSSYTSKTTFHYNNEYPSQTLSGSVSSSAPILTPEAFVQPPSLVSKGKRKLSASPVSPEATLPRRDPASFQPYIRKRRLLLNANHSSGESFESNLSLCTRCHQYLIPGAEPGMCTSCLQESSIYKWPSISASRTENMESLVLFLMPSHLERTLLTGGQDSIPRGRSWRPLAYKIPHSGSDLSLLLFQDQWTLSKQQTRSIGLFGSDYEELADIAQTFQRSLPMRNIALEAACTTLISVCDLYKCVIGPPPVNGVVSTTPITELISHVRTVRITLRNAFQQLQYLALSPSTTRSRQDWLPSFLSAAILVTTAIIFLDILGQFPSPYREIIWGTNWHDRIANMRNWGYGILLGHLKANTNGVNPLKLDCWTESPKSATSKEGKSPFIISTPMSYNQSQPRGSKDKGKGIAPISTKRKDKIETPSYFWDTPGSAQPDQDVLLGNQSPAALKGLKALKEWQVKHEEHLKQGEHMFAKELYALAMIRPMAGLYKVFDVGFGE